METRDIIGWASSVLLLATIAQQVHKQWKTEASEGVSTFLFIGQTGASVGFAIYSWLLDNMVFVVTNTLMLLSSFVGFAILQRNRRRERRRQQSS